MTTISASNWATGDASTTQQSPLAEMDDKIGAAVKAGVLSQTDATALESALSNIDSSLKSDGDTGTSSGQGSDPSRAKSKIDGLIQNQVSSGTLTTSQAQELQAFFASGPGGSGGSDSNGTAIASATQSATTGTGATNQLLSAVEQASSTDGINISSTSSTSTDSTGASTTSSSDSHLAALKTFLANLRESQASQSGTYSLDGAAATNSSGLVLNQML